MKVYFLGGFSEHVPYERGGKPIILNQKFEWGGYHFIIPAAYVCSNGLVLDICKQISLGSIKEFLNCWKQKIEDNTLSVEEREIMEFENPMRVVMNIKASINDRNVESYQMYNTCWHPYQNEVDYESDIAEELVDEYRCDKNYGWQFNRVTIPWPYKRKPKTINLSLSFEPEKIRYPCEQHFTVRIGDSGQKVEFQHPITKKTYILHVSDMASEVLPDSVLGHIKEKEFPKHFSVLSYHFISEVDNEEFRLRDCIKNDQPRQLRKRDFMEPESCEAGSVAMIGGAVGVDAIIRPHKKDKNQKREYQVASSFHFELVQQVVWRISAVITRGELLSLQFLI